MADWTSIPDATFDPDRPVLGSTHLAIVKNFEALAEGAVNAPRIQTAAIQDSNVTTAKIANANVTIAKLPIGTRSFSGTVDDNNPATISFTDDYAFALRATTLSAGTGISLRQNAYQVSTFSTNAQSYAISWRYLTT
jgi:hypothetical protein